MKTKKDRGLKRPQTGLAARIREVLKNASNPITYKTIYERGGFSPGDERSRALHAIKDFIKRGEATRNELGRIKYNHNWKRHGKSPMRDRIYKAISISNNFTSIDIRKLVTDAEQDYVEKVIKWLVKDGYLACLGEKSRDGRTGGTIRVYRVVDRIKFRMEVL